MASEIAALAPLFVPLSDADPAAVVSYDGLSDSMIWSDELPSSRPSTWWAIRPVLHHRSCLASGSPSRFSKEWDEALAAFPSWVGFRAERVRWSAQLQRDFALRRSEFAASLDAVGEDEELR